MKKKLVLIIIMFISVICYASPDFYLGIPIQTISFKGKSEFKDLYAFTLGISKTVRVSKYFKEASDGLCLSAHLDYSVWSVPAYGGSGVGSSYSSGISGLYNVADFVDVGVGIAVLGLVDHNKKILAYASMFSNGYTFSMNFHRKDSKAGLNFRYLGSELFTERIYTNISVILVLCVDNIIKQYKPVKI